MSVRVRADFIRVRAAVIRARAADLIEQEGWIQGEMHVPGKGYSIEGALDAAAVGHGGQWAAWWEGWWIMKEVRTRSKYGLEGWNDKKGRTKDEVIAALRTQP